jgi:sRNA-binding carbon storage regulator CsrA
MLILTRKPGQTIQIRPACTLHPDTRVKDLFAAGPIEILVAELDGRQVKLGITAHRDFLVLRGELNSRKEE